jgi:hypothetical protein
MMNRDVIKFRKNTPVTVKLDRGPEGKLHKTGDYLYVVNNDAGIMFLPPAARTQLLRTHAAAGDDVRITNAQDDSWHVEVLSDAHTDYSEPLKKSIHQVQQQRQATNGATALASEPQPIRSMVDHNLLARYFVLAGRALQVAHSQLLSEKLPDVDLNPPTWEDIRTAGTTLFIEHNKRQNGGQR